MHGWSEVVVEREPVVWVQQGEAGDVLEHLSERVRDAVVRELAGRSQAGDQAVVLNELLQLILVASQDLAELDEG